MTIVFRMIFGQVSWLWCMVVWKGWWSPAFIFKGQANLCGLEASIPARSIVSYYSNRARLGQQGYTISSVFRLSLTATLGGSKTLCNDFSRMHFWHTKPV